MSDNALVPDPHPQPLPQPQRVSVRAELIDATTTAATKMAGLPPQQVVNLALIVVLTSIILAFGYTIHSQQQSQLEERRERQDMEATRLREANAQAELQRNHCAMETEKVRREGSESVKSILATFLQEGERNRDYQSRENEKFRREVLSIMRNHPLNGP